VGPRAVTSMWRKLEALTPEVKSAVREAEHSPSSSTEDKNA